MTTGSGLRQAGGPAAAPVEAVFFDLGGTLFRYPQRQGGGFRFLLDAAGIEAPPERLRWAWRDAAERAGEHFGRQAYFLHRDLFRLTVTHFFDHFGRELDPEVFDGFHQRQLQSLLQHMPLREDCVATLAALRDRGLYVGLVSNIDDDYLYPLLEQHQLGSWFEHCISSEQARCCKPHPQIFHYALDKAGRRAEQGLFVGDSLHHDVAGAHQVGMRSVRIVEPDTETPLTHGLEVVAEPDFQIDNLEALIGIVDHVNGC